MDIRATLDELRMAFHECRAVAYADLGARMILVTSTEADLPQERWDDLCETGVALLTGEPARHASDAMEQGGAITHAVVLEAHELGVFLRSRANGEDVILSVSTANLPLQDFIAKAGQVLDRIAGDG